MCNPAAVAGVTAGAQALGGIMGAQSAKASAAAQTAVLDQQRRAALDIGTQKENEIRSQTEKAIGTQTAAMGGTGAVIGEGSFGKVLESTAGQGELDALTARSNALREAWGYDVQKSIVKQQAKSNVMSSILGGAAGAGTALAPIWKK